MRKELEVTKKKATKERKDQFTARSIKKEEISDQDLCRNFLDIYQKADTHMMSDTKSKFLRVAPIEASKTGKTVAVCPLR